MLRGEFIRADGLVIPNNLTIFGADTLLKAALRNTVPTFWVGLVDGVPETELQIEDLDEPTIGTNGYARQQITRDSTGWPVADVLNGEPYLESLWLTWAASGGSFDQAIRRLMIVPSQTDITGDVFALSAPLEGLVTIGVATVEDDRKFKYRLYLR